jgi:hypothetical protein
MSLSFRLHRELFFQKPEGVQSSGFLLSRPTFGALQNYRNPFNSACLDRCPGYRRSATTA